MLAGASTQRAASLLLAVGLVGSAACSESPPQDSNAGMRELYELSDLPQQIEPIATFVESALEQQRMHFTSEQFEVARRVVRDHFDPANLAEQTRERLERQQPSAFLDATLAWLRSPATRKVMGAKASVLRPPSSREEMTAFYASEQAQPTGEKRRELIERHDRSTHASDTAAQTMLMSAICVSVLVDAMQPPDERTAPEKLRESALERQKLLDPVFEEMTLIVSRFAFRNVSDAELESFVAFSESEAGQWYHETTSSALLDALREITTNLDRAFVAALSAPTGS